MKRLLKRLFACAAILSLLAGALFVWLWVQSERAESRFHHTTLAGWYTSKSWHGELQLFRPPDAQLDRSTEIALANQISDNDFEWTLDVGPNDLGICARGELRAGSATRTLWEQMNGHPSP